MRTRSYFVVVFFFMKRLQFKTKHIELLADNGYYGALDSAKDCGYISCVDARLTQGLINKVMFLRPLRETVVSLNLANCSLSDANIRCLSALLSTGPPLQELNLSGAFFTRRTAGVFFNSLMSATELSILTLISCELEHMEGHDQTVIGCDIKAFSFIQRLDMFKSVFRFGACDVVLRLLQHSPSITHVSLPMDIIRRQQDVDRVVRILEKPTITHFSALKQDVTDSTLDFAHIASAATLNGNLKSFSFTTVPNYCYELDASQLIRGFTGHASIKKIVLPRIRLSEEVLSDLKELFSQTKNLKYMVTPILDNFDSRIHMPLITSIERNPTLVHLPLLDYLRFPFLRRNRHNEAARKALLASFFLDDSLPL